MHAMQDSFTRGDRIYDMGPGSLEIKRHLQSRVETIWRYSHFPLTAARAAPACQAVVEGRRGQESGVRGQESGTSEIRSRKE